MPWIFIHYSLLPSLGFLGTTLAKPRKGSIWHNIPLSGNECAFKELTTTLGGTPRALVPRPRGPPDSWTIMHVFSSFIPSFDFPGSDDFFCPGPF